MRSQNKILVTVAIVVVLLLFSAKAKAGTKPKIETNFAPLIAKYGLERSLKLQFVLQALLGAGFPRQKVLLALSQVMQETGVFGPNSRVSAEDNNYTGILFINKPAVQKNATQGRPFPIGESKTAHYAHFTTPADWANDYIRILNLPPNYPISATSPVDFVSKLKGNGFFTGSETTYANNVSFFYNLLNSIGI